jgi:uncharacterized protein (DUF433 family)
MERITFDTNQCGGKPCVRGLRIRVSDVLELLATGISIKDIIEVELPDLEYEDVVACLNYAVSKLNHPVIKAA